MDPNLTFFSSQMRIPDPLDPYYGRLAGSGSVWRDTDPDPGHINMQNNAMAKKFCLNRLILIFNINF